MRERNSLLVLGSSLKTPIMELVTVRALIFCTPRITLKIVSYELIILIIIKLIKIMLTMHMWLASTTTATPLGLMASSTARAISFVSLS